MSTFVNRWGTAVARSQLLALIRHAGSEPDEPDAHLLCRFVATRDPAAFADLVRRYARLVWTLCRALLPSEADADDAFQATFLALAESAKSVRDPDRLGPWLHAVAHRVCLNARRTAARRTRRERASAAQEGTRPVADSAWNTAAAAVHEEVGRLPNALRVAFVLCCLEGKAPSAAAAELGVPDGTFSARLSRAKRRLLERLAERGIGAAVAVGVAGSWAAPTAAAVERAVTLGSRRATVPVSVSSLVSGVAPMGMLRVKAAVLTLALLPLAVLVFPGGGTVGPEARAQPAKPAGEAKPPKLDLHGDPLPEKALMRLGTVKYRVPNLSGVGFKKTGELVALNEKLELHTFPADGSPKASVTKLQRDPERSYWRLAISADARFVAAHIGEEKKLKVWDISGEKPVEHLTRDMTDAYSIAFSPDGNWLAVNDTGRGNGAVPVLLGDVTKKEWHLFPLPRVDHVEQFSFTDNGKYLAVVAGNGTTVIETASQKVMGTVSMPKERARAAAVSPDGKTVALMPMTWLFGNEPTAKFFTTDTGSDAEGLIGPTASAAGIDFSPDGKTLRVSGSGRLREWDPVAGKWLRELALPTPRNHSPVWSPDGRRFAIHNAATLVLADAKTWKPLHPEALAAGHADAIFGITVSPDGKVIATDGEEIRLWDSATGKLLGQAKSTWGNAPTLAFLPDSKSFIAVAEQNIPVVRDARTGKELRRFKLPEEFVKKVSLRDLRLSDDGKTLTTHAESASSEWKSYLLRWDVATGEVTGQVEAKNGRERELFGYAASPDGQWVAQFGTLQRSDGGDKEPTTVLPREEAGFYGAAWSADSSRVAMPRALGTVEEKHKNGSMVVFDVAKKQKVCELNTGVVARSAFSPDGKFLATVGGNQIVVWDVAAVKEVFRAEADTGNTIYARAIAFTPDGKRLITGHGTTALLWDVSDTTGKK